MSRRKGEITGLMGDGNTTLVADALSYDNALADESACPRKPHAARGTYPLGLMASRVDKKGR
jgi:hypothetical protein